MTVNLRRLAGWALIVGSIVAVVGYLAANLLAPGSGEDVFRYEAWPLFEGIALVGDVIVALGLPVILTFAGRAPKLHIIGYSGIFAALVMLNLGEGTTEAFVKPYLVAHGGLPAEEPTGFAVFEGVALLALVIGSICLGIAVLRARVLPWWIGVALIVSCLVGALGLPGAWFLLPDCIFFAALVAIGTVAVRPAPAPATAELAGARTA
ncbi:hypothetical protein ACFFX1_00290 [Dactylosporangium sucinum]|uniref:Uncharacterized protein n=1 Tax=Dactylosporangium sucinum TaxID=1424081 RepID=A0A917WQD2_9ACTN|nr:hypothetical protein [Dactylosporangium sucinum]GGM21067.1 hypothetical protein GCM10007977_022690 [Dactylosporangium sucinum]